MDLLIDMCLNEQERLFVKNKQITFRILVEIKWSAQINKQ